MLLKEYFKERNLTSPDLVSDGKAHERRISKCAEKNTKEIVMKKMLISTVLIAGLATAGIVYAHGGYGMHGYGMMESGMMGSGMMSDYGGNDGDYHCPGAAGYGPNDMNSERNQKFLNGTVELRKQMNDKRFEYQEALRNPSTTREQLASVEKEMIDLRTKIYDKTDQR
jgi:hypothetical protein